MNLNTNINNISKTAFLTLQCHARDAKSRKPVLNDQSSVSTIEKIKSAIGQTDSDLYKRITGDKIKRSLVFHTATRAKQYDNYIRSFISNYPDAAVINIGCGLDDRFTRVDNGKINFYDLDLPDIMDIKKQIFPASGRYNQISRSVFDFEWIEMINNEHVILVAEGVFMYCEEDDVKALFQNLKTRLHKPEIILKSSTASGCMDGGKSRWKLNLRSS